MAGGGRRVTDRTYTLAAILGAAMAVSTVAGTLVGVLAPFLRDEIDGLTPARVGLLVAVFAVVSGAMAWPSGILTDSMGGRRSLLLVFVGSFGGLVVLSSAGTYAWLIVAMTAAGLANSAVNPATNRVIAVSVPAGSRGLVAGIKMAGVQLAVFASGLLIPPVVEAFGWRLPLAVAGAVVAAAGILGVVLFVEREEITGVGNPSRPRFEWSAELLALTVYSLLMSGGASSVVTYIPLYTVEALESTGQVGGLAIAVIGLLAIVGRLVLGRATERVGRPMRSLATVAALALISAGLLTLADSAGSALFWIGTAGLGLSALSFIAGTTVAVILSMPRARVGGASGVMFVGFMIGFGGGPAAFGALVDATGGYTAGWVLVLVLFGVAGILAIAASRASGSG